MSESVATGFKASDCLLESFLISLTDTHDFTDCTHLCAEFIFNTFEFLKCPTSKFDYNVVSVWNIFIKSSVFSARNVLQSKTCCKHCRHPSNRETGCFRSKCGRTGSSWVDLDDNISVCLRIVCPLYVTTTDYFNRIYDFVGFLL